MLSADSYFELSLRPLVYRYFNNLYPDGNDPGDVAPDGPSDAVTWSWLSHGYAASYSPNPENPPYDVDLPIAFPSGRLIDDVWQRWLAFDPVVAWPSRVDEIRSLRGILLAPAAATTGISTGAIASCTRPGPMRTSRMCTANIAGHTRAGSTRLMPRPWSGSARPSSPASDRQPPPASRSNTSSRAPVAGWGCSPAGRMPSRSTTASDRAFSG
jgi:hypothetical protein